MLRKMSGFLFKATVNGFFFYFTIIIKHRTAKAQSARPQKQALQTRVL